MGPDGLERVEAAIAKEKRARERHRLETIRLGMLGQYTMAEVAERSRVSRATLGTWTQRFREGGIQGLLESRYSERGRKPQLGPEVIEELRGHLKSGRFKRAKEVRRWLEEEHAIRMGINGVYYWLGKSAGVLKVSRKTHARKDAAAGEAFKEELRERLQG